MPYMQHFLSSKDGRIFLFVGKLLRNFYNLKRIFPFKTHSIYFTAFWDNLVFVFNAIYAFIWLYFKSKLLISLWYDIHTWKEIKTIKQDGALLVFPVSLPKLSLDQCLFKFKHFTFLDSIVWIGLGEFWEKMLVFLGKNLVCVDSQLAVAAP